MSLLGFNISAFVTDDNNDKITKNQSENLKAWRQDPANWQPKAV